MKKPLLTLALGLSAVASPAEACKMSLMGASGMSYADAISYVLSKYSVKEQAMHSVKELYRAYGAVVIEVQANDEAGTCRAHVLDIDREPDCTAKIIERDKQYECRG